MTASTNIVRLQDMVRLSTPGVLDGTIRMEVFNVLKEFFQRTDAWLLELPVYIVPLICDYQLNPCQNVVVNRLMGLGRSDNPNASFSYVPMCPQQFFAAGGSNTSYGLQNPLFRSWRGAMLLNAGAKTPIMRIVDNPSSNETWIATVALAPCDPVDSDGFVEPPDWVMEKYLRGIASGVISALMLQPGKPYSSLPGAQYHGRKFNEAVGLARKEVRHMFVWGAQRWAFPMGGYNTPRPRLPTGGGM
jgi:hypothetical protein